jgi:hypothetical protein
MHIRSSQWTTADVSLAHAARAQAKEQLQRHNCTALAQNGMISAIQKIMLLSGDVVPVSIACGVS